jgi:hypothetical protein
LKKSVVEWSFTTTQIEINPISLIGVQEPQVRICDNCPMNCGNEIVYISYAVLIGPYNITQLTHAARCWKGKKPNLRKIAKKLRRNVTLQKRAREVGLSLVDYRERMRGIAKWNRSRFDLRNPDGSEMKLYSPVFPTYRAYLIGSVEK